MNWIWFIYSTLGSASVYAVIALGVVIVYRTNRVLPFHIGQIGIFCAYLFTSLWTPEQGFGLNFALAALAVIAAAGIMGIVMHVLIDRWGARYGHFTGTVITIAAAATLTGLMSYIWRGQVRRFRFLNGQTEILGSHISINSLLMIAISGIIILGTLLWIRRSRMGIDMQAVANNTNLARLRGIPVNRRLIAAWIASSLLAAAGGIMNSSMSVLSLEGSVVGITAIIAAILGGMQSMAGAAIGSLLVAMGEIYVTTAFDPRYSQVVPVLMLVLLLTFRPSGLSGRVEEIRRV